jgi:hypothetical protein
MTDPAYGTGDPDGATPIGADEAQDLIPAYVATRADLNLAEQSNIVAARVGLDRLRRSRSFTPDRVLDEQFCRRLHRLMFGQVWRWAGTYRLTERNIGIDPWSIPTAVGGLMGGAPFTWGSTSLVDTGTTRSRYIEALRTADKGDLAPLGDFVRS